MWSPFVRERVLGVQWKWVSPARHASTGVILMYLGNAGIGIIGVSGPVHPAEPAAESEQPMKRRDTASGLLGTLAGVLVAVCLNHRLEGHIVVPAHNPYLLWTTGIYTNHYLLSRDSRLLARAGRYDAREAGEIVTNSVMGEEVAILEQTAALNGAPTVRSLWQSVDESVDE